MYRLLGPHYHAMRCFERTFIGKIVANTQQKPVVPPDHFSHLLSFPPIMQVFNILEAKNRPYQFRQLLPLQAEINEFGLERNTK